MFFISASALLGLTLGAPVLLSAVLAGSTEAFEYYHLTYNGTLDLFSITSVTYSVLGVLAFTVTGWSVFQFVGRKRQLPRLTLQAEGARKSVLILLLVLLAIHLFFLMVPMLRSIPSLDQLAQPAGVLAFVAFFHFALRRELPLPLTLAVFGVALPFALATYVSNGATQPIMVLLLGAALVIWRHRGTPPVLPALAAVVVFVSLYNIAYFTREYTWGNEDRYSVTDRLKIFSGVAYNAVTGDVLVSIDGEPITSRGQFMSPFAMQRIFQRVAVTPHLSQAMRVTPNEIPLWGGSSYTPLMTSMIPRAIFPEKPREELGGYFSKAYWKYDLPSMSMNVPWIVELYVNFSLPGIIVGMAFFGGLLVVLERLLCPPKAGPLEFALGFVVLYPFVFPESNFSLMMGSKAMLVLVVWLYFRGGQRLLGQR